MVSKVLIKRKSILDQEKKLIQQKKVLSADEYKNKVSELRKKSQL